MKNILLVIWSFLPGLITAQTIDWNYFSEEVMTMAMFSEMNEYVKMIHKGDSLILSGVIQQEIMPRNYTLIKDNRTLPLNSLHNMEWFIPDRGNDLHDTLRTKIIEEYTNPKQLESKFMKDFNCYGPFCYTEILQSKSYQGIDPHLSYQELARKFIAGWNSSPPVITESLKTKTSYQEGITNFLVHAG